jgi:hypothetical protein
MKTVFTKCLCGHGLTGQQTLLYMCTFNWSVVSRIMHSTLNLLTMFTVV